MFRREDFPQEATLENIQDLIRIGRRIDEAKPELFRHERRKRFTFLSIMAEGILAEFFGFSAFFLSLGLTTLINLDAVSVEFRPYVFLLLFLILGLLAGKVFMTLYGLTKRIIGPRLIIHILRKLGYAIPPLEYDIFSHSCAITENILNRERRKAQKMSYFFSRDLLRYIHINAKLEDTIFPELKTVNDSIAFERMILFSEEQEMPLLFMNLSLSIIHKDFPRIYSLTADLDYSLNRWKTEEPQGRLKSFINFLEERSKSLQGIIVFATIILTFILAILRILGLIRI